MKKTITRITAVLMIVTILLTATSCGTFDTKFRGTYTNSSGSGSIVVNKNTVDFNNVSIGYYVTAYTRIGTFEYEMTLNVAGVPCDVQETSDGVYDVTGQVSINGITVDIEAELYYNNGSPYITMYGTTYDK